MSSVDFMHGVQALAQEFPQIEACYHRARSGIVTLEEIICRSPGKGIGSTYLEEVVALADRTETVLRLVATPIGDLKPRMLANGRYAIERWYQRFGFVYEGESLQIVGMRRLPIPSLVPAL